MKEEMVTELWLDKRNMYIRGHLWARYFVTVKQAVSIEKHSKQWIQLDHYEHLAL